MQQALTPPTPVPELILLFGMPRSGTTWIGKIFDSHPATLYRHEPCSRGSLNFMPLFTTAADDAPAAAGLHRFVRALPEVKDEKVSASLPIFPKQHYRTGTLWARRATVYGAKVLSRKLGPLPVPDPFRVRGAPGIPVWKSIECLGRLGSIVRLQPGAAGIRILRDPCGFVSSVLRGEARGKFESRAASSEDWGLFELIAATDEARAAGLDLAALRAMAPDERLAAKWAIYHEHALNDTEGLPAVMSLRYEDMCRQPLEVTARVFQHCGLAMAPQTERFLSASTSRSSGEYYSVFKNPLESAYKWRDELSADSVQRIRRVVARFKVGQQYADE